ncbi:MAG: PEP-CTERM sorting domain-containing protein [Fimbriimonas sp.]
MNNKTFGILALTLVAVSANAAISFSNIATPAGVTATVVGSGISFKADDFFFGNSAGTRNFSVSYTVASDAGVLTNAQLSNSGLLKKAWLTGEVTHSSAVSKTWTVAGAAAGNLTPVKFVEFTDAVSYNVTLSVSAAADAGGYVNAKTTNVAYNEAVPEPASMAALALGFGIIAKRRNRK